MITNRSGRPSSLRLVMMATERQADFVWNSTTPYRFPSRRPQTRVYVPIRGELVTRPSLPKRNSSRKRDVAIADMQQFSETGVTLRNMTLSIHTLMSKLSPALEVTGLLVESPQYGLRLQTVFNGNV
ncbi:hypothetical protein Ocin01_19869 [Orchesella cincta]|uniref:Uncharacterized protein n=1 Tax=Orchesella cincta TaxID=48709 RepID=A0A1D2M1H8_ORCCI|nr:hypothetical protein Ocin01_19869 [Orchesella cincta]